MVPGRLVVATSSILKRQKDRVEADFKAGKIDQKEYEIRKDQIA